MILVFYSPTITVKKYLLLNHSSYTGLWCNETHAAGKEGSANDSPQLQIFNCCTFFKGIGNNSFARASTLLCRWMYPSHSTYLGRSHRRNDFTMGIEEQALTPSLILSSPKHITPSKTVKAKPVFYGAKMDKLSLSPQKQQFTRLLPFPIPRITANIEKTIIIILVWLRLHKLRHLHDKNPFPLCGFLLLPESQAP